MGKSFCVSVILIVLSITVYGSGNITTSSGDLYLKPEGFDTYVDGNLRLNRPPYIFSKSCSSLVSMNVNSSISSRDAGFLYRVDGENRFFFYLDNSRGDAFRIYDYTADSELFYAYPNGYLRLSPADHLILDPGNDQVLPGEDKVDDLGSSSKSWDDCYCDDIYGTTHAEDVVFTNDWRITEIEDQLVFQNPSGKNVFSLSPSGKIYAKEGAYPKPLILNPFLSQGQDTIDKRIKELENEIQKLEEKNTKIKKRLSELEKTCSLKEK